MQYKNSRRSNNINCVKIFPITRHNIIQDKPISSWAYLEILLFGAPALYWVTSKVQGDAIQKKTAAERIMSKCLKYCKLTFFLRPSNPTLKTVGKKKLAKWSKTVNVKGSICREEFRA